MGGWRYVSCFIWDHNLYRVWHHITPRATGCMVFGCMEGKTKNPTSNNSDKRWETGAQFLFCCLTFCCLMFLEFSQWHVLWKKDMTCIFQICMCTAVEWSAICLPWVSPSAYGASQLLGFGNRFVENWKVMGGIGKTQPCNLSDSEPSCQLQYVYSIDTVSGEAGSKVIYPSKSRQSCSQKHVQSILKSLEYEAQIMATRFFLPRYSYKRQEHVEGVWRGFFDRLLLFFLLQLSHDEMEQYHLRFYAWCSCWSWQLEVTRFWMLGCGHGHGEMPQWARNVKLKVQSFVWLNFTVFTSS